MGGEKPSSSRTWLTGILPANKSNQARRQRSFLASAHPSQTCSCQSPSFSPGCLLIWLKGILCEIFSHLSTGCVGVLDKIFMKTPSQVICLISILQNVKIERAAVKGWGLTASMRRLQEHKNHAVPLDRLLSSAARGKRRRGKNLKARCSFHVSSALFPLLPFSCISLHLPHAPSVPSLSSHFACFLSLPFHLPAPRGRVFLFPRDWFAPQAPHPHLGRPGLLGLLLSRLPGSHTLF